VDVGVAAASLARVSSGQQAALTESRTQVGCVMVGMEWIGQLAKSASKKSQCRSNSDHEGPECQERAVAGSGSRKRV
jgi:hypothetical protein